MFALIAGCLGITSTATAADQQDLMQLLDSRQCRACQLSDVDLTHVDLRDADLQGAHLQRANLSQARLDGADLSGSDLSFTSFQGASLRGADLRNSRLMGTDLRRTDLTGALLDQNALDQSHWIGARGVSQGARSHAGLHNAGVDAAQEERWPMAEQLFSAAIAANPEEPLSWVARGLSRGEQGKDDLASRDLAHAGQLFADQGDIAKAEQLKEASEHVYEISNKPDTPSGNGIGSSLLSGAISAAQALAPIALKALMPMMP
tara:strand:+ start:625 stop:1410 length:786 start_codon:yes stop_codon:yes gene_type:complete